MRDDSWAAPFVRYDNFFSTTPDRTPVDLVSLLTTHPDPICDAATCAGKECAFKKSARSWSPVTLVEGTTRANANVVAVNYFVADLDHLSLEGLERVCERVDGYAAALYSTHNHAPPANGSYRLVMPLSRSATPAEWPLVRAAVVYALELPADPMTKDLSRLYALPDCRAGVEPFAASTEGEAIDVDEALQIARDRGLGSPLRPTPTTSIVTPLPPPESFDLGAMRIRLSEVRRSKAQSADPRRKEQAAILGRILDGEPLAKVGERDGTILRAAGLLAYWLPAGCPFCVVREILRPSLLAMLAAEPDPRGLEYMFGVAEQKYVRQVASRAESDARRADENAKIKAIIDRVSGAASLREAGDAAEAEGIEDGWQSLLLEGKSGPKSCEFNVDLILSCAPEFRDALVWNEFSKMIEIRAGELHGVPQNSIDGRAAGVLQSKYDCMAGEHLVGRALLRVARENAYDPIAEYLGELAWDGIGRLDTFLEAYFGVDVSAPEKAKYVRAVSRKWLISLVARALRPGVKVDTVLILEGLQGVGKSTVLEALVGNEYFLDTALDVGSKDTLQAIAGAWLIELGELASFRKAEQPRIRQFITSKVDKFRPPFGRVVEASPRRCVLVGTTNPEEGGYLSDRTGNRRYWPVYVGVIDADGVARDRDQILAEAVVAFRAGEQWWLTKDETTLAAMETAERMVDLTFEEAIERWWYGEVPVRRPDHFGILDVAEMALKLTTDRVDHRVRVEIGYALRRLGFVRRGKSRQYEPTPEMRAAPQQINAARQAQLTTMQKFISGASS